MSNSPPRSPPPRPHDDHWDDGPVLLMKGDICRKLCRPDNPCEVLMVIGDILFVIDKRTLFAEFAAPGDYEFVRRPLLSSEFKRALRGGRRSGSGHGR
jgi:hypothetical protein